MPRLSRLFPGDSDMARRMRAFDWSATPLGPAQTWPNSLRTSVRIVLSSRQPMFLWWGEQLTTLYNDSCATFLHLMHPEALGAPAPSVLAEAWQQLAPRIELMRRLKQGAYHQAVPLILSRKGYPEEVDLTYSYCPIVNDDGSVGGILCPFTDDTERIASDRQLRLLQKLAERMADARSSRAACALAIDALATNATDLPFALIQVFEGDETGPGAAPHCGFTEGATSAADLLLRDDRFFASISEALTAQQPIVVSDLTAIAERLPVTRGGLRPEHAVITPLPIAESRLSRRGVLVSGVNPLRQYDSDYRRFLALVADAVAAGIDHAEAYDEERRRADTLANLDRAKTMFFNNVSHEFRTPLTLMIGPLEEELRGSDTGERLEVVHRNARRLLKLVNTLLDFSRIQTGKFDAAFEPTDLAAMTADVASVFRSAIESAGMSFRVDCPPIKAAVYVDRDMWEKIVLNLLSNAYKFTREGEIAVSLRASPRQVTLSVRDTGVGIPAFELQHVFDAFHRVRSTFSRTTEGSGIGLSLVRELAHLHGGRVEVDSVTGRGTTFRVALPLGKAHLPPGKIAQTRSAEASRRTALMDEAELWVSDAGAPAATASSSDGTPEVKPSRILLVDDNADLRNYMTRLLAPEHDVIAVPDGMAALAAIHERRPDLVLADVMMPRLDGFALTAKLRADPATASLPIILLSARAEEQAQVEGLDRGADDYLVKPFGAHELRARVRTHLALARMRSEAQRALEVKRDELERVVRERTATLREREAALHELNDRLEERVRERTMEINTLFARLISAQEEERRRFARDVHDQLGQAMTALRMNLEALRKKAGPATRLTEQLDRTGKLAEELDQSIDFLTSALRPPALDELGLTAALRNVVAGWSERFGITAGFDVTGDDHKRLPREVEVNLYRVAQEALHNVVKHARATRVAVRLERSVGGTVLMVEDDGRGFDPEAIVSDGLGLVSMRERAMLAGGQFAIESRLTGGTSISVRVPTGRES